MKKLLILLLLPLFSFSQTYDELISINSLDTWKKVVIENDYEYVEWDEDREDNEWVTYGYGVIKDSTLTTTSVEIMSSYNTKDDRFSFQMPMKYEDFFGAMVDTDMAQTYNTLSKDIKANCEYSEIINYKGDDFVVYTCSNRKYGFAIGVAGYGIVRYFPDGVTDE